VALRIKSPPWCCQPAQNGATEALAGLVERVTFHNEENGFCVLRVKARGQRDLITVLGHAAMISAGEFVQASGAWVNDRTHGVQFRALFLKAMPPTTTEGIEKYLGSGMIRGIGPVYAKKLVRAFGQAVFDVIEQEPPRLREVTGIGPKRAQRIIAGWAEQKVIREIMLFLHSNSVGTSRAVRIYKTYGADAVQLISENRIVSPRHSRYRLPHRRPDRDQARHRENRAHSRPCRHLLRARRGDGRRTLRPANGRAHSPRAEAARGVAGAGRDGYRPRTSGRHRHCR
jgi:ATP-dependent exoDNAse (exonuclease V) alpha subunit